MRTSRLFIFVLILFICFDLLESRRKKPVPKCPRKIARRNSFRDCCDSRSVLPYYLVKKVRPSKKERKSKKKSKGEKPVWTIFKTYERGCRCMPGCKVTVGSTNVLVPANEVQHVGCFEIDCAAMQDWRSSKVIRTEPRKKMGLCFNVAG